MSNRVFVKIAGRASRVMECEACRYPLDDVEGKPNQRRHVSPLDKKPLFVGQKDHDRHIRCVNSGKVYEFPYAIEVKEHV